MSADKNEKPDRRKQRRQARGKLLAFLKRLRSGCSAMNDLDRWYKATHELESLLQEHGADFVSQDVLKPVREAMHVTDSTRAGLQQACRVLGVEVEKAVKKGLPVGGGLAATLAGVVIVGAVAVAAFVGYVEYTAVEVVVVNNGCAECPLCGELLPSWVPGVSPPDRPIRSGEKGTAKLPRTAFEINWTARDSGVLTIPPGPPLPIPAVPARVVSVTYNGRELLGQVTAVNLGAPPPHEIVFQCR